MCVTRTAKEEGEDAREGEPFGLRVGEVGGAHRERHLDVRRPLVQRAVPQQHRQAERDADADGGGAEGDTDEREDEAESGGGVSRTAVRDAEGQVGERLEEHDRHRVVEHALAE